MYMCKGYHIWSLHIKIDEPWWEYPKLYLSLCDPHFSNPSVQYVEKDYPSLWHKIQNSKKDKGTNVVYFWSYLIFDLFFTLLGKIQIVYKTAQLFLKSYAIRR